MTDLLYSFDTSVFINGRRDLLPPEIFLTLWANIEQMIAAGAIRAVDVVRDELGRRDDATRAWAVAQEGLTSSKMLLRKVIDWLTRRR